MGRKVNAAAKKTRAAAPVRRVKQDRPVLPIDYALLPIDALVKKINSFNLWKRIPTYFLLLFSLYAAAKEATNETAGIALASAAVIFYLFLKYYYRDRLAAQALKKQKAKLVALRNAILPSLSACVYAYTKHWTVWPDEVAVPDRDLPSIQLILARKTGKQIPIPLVKRLVDYELNDQAFRKFSSAFFEALKSDKSVPFNEKSACALYQDIFGANKKNIEHLREFLLGLGFKRVKSKDLIEAVDEQYKTRSVAARAKDIQWAVSGKRSAVNIFTLSDIDQFSGTEFERFLQKIFEKMGFLVQTTKASGDQGADLLIEKYGRKIIVQAKRYSRSVGNSAIQESVAAKAYYKYDTAMVVTNSYFTKSAAELAAANNVELINRDKLSELIAVYPIYK